MVTPKQALISSSVALALASVAPAGASELEVLKEQIQVLSQEIQQLKSDQNTVSYSRRAGAAKAGEAVTTGKKGNSIMIGGTQVQFGGFVRTDFNWDLDFQTGTEEFAEPGNLPSGLQQAGGGANPRVAEETRFIASARPSRFFIDLKKKAGNGTPIRGHLEIDANTGEGNERVSNSVHLRLRHAYFDYGKIKVGQTYTNYMQFHSRVPQLNFSSTSGGAFVRQPQVRFTTGNIAISLENPENSFLGGKIEEVPDLVGRWEQKFGSVKVGVSGILGQLKTAADDDIAWAVMGSASFGLGKGSKIVAKATISEGLNRYHAQAAGAPAAAVVGGQIVATELVTYSVGWMQKLGAGTLTLYYGRNDFDTVAARPAGVIRDTNDRTYINYIWSPARGISFGVEVGRDARSDVGFSEEDNIRIQFTGTYNFTK